jgi:hypothetical protein
MKKIIASGLLAIALIAMSQQQASAWVNSKFGIGLNWERQSGANNLFWGAWHNGQVPGPEAFQNGPYTGGYSGGAYPPAPYYYPSQGYSPYAGSYDMPPASPYYAAPSQYANPAPAYYSGR